MKKIFTLAFVAFAFLVQAQLGVSPFCYSFNYRTGGSSYSETLPHTVDTIVTSEKVLTLKSKKDDLEVLKITINPDSTFLDEIVAEVELLSTLYEAQAVYSERIIYPFNQLSIEDVIEEYEYFKEYDVQLKISYPNTSIVIRQGFDVEVFTFVTPTDKDDLTNITYYHAYDFQPFKKSRRLSYYLESVTIPTYNEYGDLVKYEIRDTLDGELKEVHHYEYDVNNILKTKIDSIFSSKKIYESGISYYDSEGQLIKTVTQYTGFYGSTETDSIVYNADGNITYLSEKIESLNFDNYERTYQVFFNAEGIWEGAVYHTDDVLTQEVSNVVKLNNDLYTYKLTTVEGDFYRKIKPRDAFFKELAAEYQYNEWYDYDSTFTELAQSKIYNFYANGEFKDALFTTYSNAYYGGSFEEKFTTNRVFDTNDNLLESITFIKNSNDIDNYPTRKNTYFYDCDNELGTDELSANDFIEIFPNPVSSEGFSLKTSLPIESLKLYNQSGLLISEWSNPTDIYNTSELKEGVYIVHIETQSETFVQKLLVR